MILKCNRLNLGLQKNGTFAELRKSLEDENLEKSGDIQNS